MTFEPKKIELPSRRGQIPRLETNDHNFTTKEAKVKLAENKKAVSQTPQEKSKQVESMVFNTILCGFLFIVSSMIFTFVYSMWESIRNGWKISTNETILMVGLSGLLVLILYLFVKSLKKTWSLLKALNLGKEFVMWITSSNFSNPERDNKETAINFNGQKLTIRHAEFLVKLITFFMVCFFSLSILQGNIAEGIIVLLILCVVRKYMIKCIKEAEAKSSDEENKKGKINAGDS